MAMVWAFRVGAWTSDPSTGWSHTIGPFHALSDLMKSLDRARLRGMVRRLAIVAHGDHPGVIVLDHRLTPATISHFATELNRLRWYLTPNAMLAFYSCIAGMGEEGSRLLIALSRHLPGRTIVGFELYGLIGPGGLPNAPGNMTATEAAEQQMAMLSSARHGRLSPWCPFAKHARDGQIVHLPILEQDRRPNRTCANPACPGHAMGGQSCTGW
jgi:hypothetical protein